MALDLLSENRGSGDRDAEHLLLGKRIAAAMVLVAVAASCAALLLTDLSRTAFTGQLAVTAVLAATGIATLILPPRRAVLQATVLLFVVGLSAVVATADEVGSTRFFYLWPAVFAAYFCSVRCLVMTLLTLTASLALALGVSTLEWADKLEVLAGTIIRVGFMAGIVGFMSAREERLHQRLELAAQTDPVTGLPNRRAFDEQLPPLVERALANQKQLSVVMVDLDRFKAFNDTHGYAAGDDALRRLATILDDHCRSVDVVARFGGEEFVVVLPGVGVAGARSYAERVAWAMRSEGVDPALRLIASSGIATLNLPAEDADDSRGLLGRADQALHAAKHAGGARASWWRLGEIEVGDEVDVPSPDAESSVTSPPPLRPREYVLRKDPLAPRDDAGGGLRESA